MAHTLCIVSDLRRDMDAWRSPSQTRNPSQKPARRGRHLRPLSCHTCSGLQRKWLRLVNSTTDPRGLRMHQPSENQEVGEIPLRRSGASDLTLQRHFNALPKFARVESRVLCRKRQRNAAFYTSVNLCVRKHVRRSVAVGLKEPFVWSPMHALPSVIRRLECVSV